MKQSISFKIKLFAFLLIIIVIISCISNLYIKDEDNRTTEIDLIMINPKGIFVFESKNVSGYIYGNPEKKYWTQYIGKNNKIELFNPIWQNKKHIQYI